MAKEEKVKRILLRTAGGFVGLIQVKGPLDEIFLREYIPPGRPHVFTTMRVCQGQGCFLQNHFKRLMEGAHFIFSGHTFFPDQIYDFMNQGVAQMKELFPHEFGVKVILSPELSMIGFPVERVFSSFPPLKLAIAQTRRAEGLIPPFLKINNSLENMIEIKEAEKRGLEDVLYLDHDDNIMECSTSNIFFVSKDEIYTPRLRPGILDGITRKRLIDCLKEKDLPTPYCRDISLDELLNADEVWLTSSLKGIRPIERIEDRLFEDFQSSHSWTHRIMKMFEEYCQSPF